MPRIPVFGLMRTGWRDGIFAGIILAAAITAACGCFGPAAAQTAQASPLCGGEELTRGTVSRVIDGRTFLLGDGREVRLAAIEVPLLQAPQSSRQDAGQEFEPKVQRGAGQRRGQMRTGRAGRARRRRSGFAAAGGSGSGSLRPPPRLCLYRARRRRAVRPGRIDRVRFGRVGDRIGGRACATDLLKRENAARTAKLGLWADPYYEVLDAEITADVLAHRGRFALIEGRVVSVRESGATIYVNFGRHWSEDFTVTVLKRNERNFAAAGLDLKSLEGRRIRVRGWVDGAAVQGATTGFRAALQPACPGSRRRDPSRSRSPKANDSDKTMASAVTG